MSLRLRRAASRITAVLGVAALASGCVPPCENVCNKLVFDCELQDDVQHEGCTLACSRQVAAYEADADTEKRDAFNDQRWCIAQNTCEDIQSGRCYDERIFAFSWGESPNP